MLAGKGADKQRTFPRRKPVGRVEGHARRRNRRHPVVNGRLHACLSGAVMQLLPGIVDTVADNRPAIVLASRRDVDLVPPFGAVLMRPQFAGDRMDGCALQIAVAIAPDFRLGAGLPDKRIVLRNAAVGIDANDFAQVRVEGLGAIFCDVAFTGGGIKRTIACNGNPRAKVMPTSNDIGLRKNQFHVRQCHIGEPRTDHCRAGTAFHRLREREIKPTTLCEVRRYGHVEQSALIHGVHRWHAGNRRADLAVSGDHTQAASPFGYQHAQRAVARQKGERPGVIEPFGDHRRRGAT